MYIDLIIYFVLVFIILFFCAKVSYKLNLVDVPDVRKIHSKDIAFTGGIGIAIALMLSIFFTESPNDNLNLVLSISFLISLVGLIDDKYHLNVGGKLSLQIIPIFYLIVMQSLFLNNLGDYNYFKINLGSFSIPFTLLCVLFLINSFNYFDGMDGTLSFATISVLIILYLLVPDKNLLFFFKIIFLTISIFLLFNFSLFKLPKMFLGDSGSLLLGFIISFILIYLANQNLIHPLLLAWSIAIFVYEFLAVNIVRLRNKKSPFKAGKDHLHHILFKETNSVFFTNIIIFFLNIVLFLIGYISFILVAPVLSLILFILMIIPFLILRNKYSKLI